jgi:hypothetical protein
MLDVSTIFTFPPHRKFFFRFLKLPKGEISAFPHAAPRQTEHDDVISVRILFELFREQPPSFGSVYKGSFHAAVTAPV